MVTLIIDIVMFVSWFGAWSTHSGFGAFIIALLWVAIMGAAVADAWFGACSNVINLISGGVLASIIVGPIVIILYFCGLGDWTSAAMPGLCPKGGYWFSEASATWIQHILFWIWIGWRSKIAFGVLA